MAVKEIDLPDVGPIKIYKRRGARSIRLSVTATGEIRVSQPTWMPYKAGLAFAAGRVDWILQNIRTQRVFAHGQRVGKTHQIFFLTGSRLRSRRQDQKIIITHPFGEDRTSPTVQQCAEKAALAALKHEAETLLPPRLQSLAQAHGFTYASCSARKLKSRWGSCSTDKHIMLNIFLMELPWELIDYVLLHELTHTKAMHHGKEFWDILTQTEPRAKQLRKAIREYHPAF